MEKKWEKRETPLSTFDELCDEYGIEFTEKINSGKNIIPLIDDDRIRREIDLDNLTLSDLFPDRLPPVPSEPESVIKTYIDIYKDRQHKINK